MLFEKKCGHGLDSWALPLSQLIVDCRYHYDKNYIIIQHFKNIYNNTRNNHDYFNYYFKSYKH